MIKFFKTKLKKHLFILFILSLLTGIQETSAQKTVQVVSKEIEESFEVRDGSDLQIVGERAEIAINGYDGDVVLCQVTLVSKHANVETAKEELNYLKWISEEFGKSIALRNYVELPAGIEKPSSNLKAIYTISVPNNMEIKVSDYFGIIDINFFTGELNITSEFSKVYLSDISGEIDVTSKFGDIRGNNLFGKVELISNRADISLSNISGTFEIDAKVANIELSDFSEVESLEIDASKSKIIFLNPESNRFNYELEIENGEWILPEHWKFNIESDSDKLKKAEFQIDKSRASIVLDLKFGSVEFALK